MIRMLSSLVIFMVFASSASEPITEFELASPGHRPQAITTGPDGNLWVTEVLKHKILRVTPDGKVTEFPVPGEKVGVLQGIAAGPDGKIWFTSREENAVRRLTVDGKFDASFELPSKATLPKSMTPGCWPREIAPGPDKTLWVAEMAANKIACISADGTVKEFAIPTEHSQPYCVAMSKDNAIWFTESVGNKIGRLDPQTGKITEFAIPTADAHARELTPGPDGNIWFAENKAHKIGKLTPDGKFEEFDVPTKECQPLGITAGNEGNIWFCEFKAGKVSRITPAGKITEFTLPTPNAQPFCITSGPDGNIWVAEQANRIARIDLKTLLADK